MQPEEFQAKEFQRAFTVSRETLARLETYNALLHKWQKAINLVSPDSLKDSWGRHFADSAQLSDLIHKDLKVCDLGSGAGFPGLVLAVMRPDLEIHLVESDGRKCEFLKNVSRETGASVTVHNKRVEDILETIRPGLITARAFAPLKEILKLTDKLSVEYLLLKGRGVEAEVQEAQANYSFDTAYTPSQTDKDARILSLKNVQKRN